MSTHRQTDRPTDRQTFGLIEASLKNQNNQKKIKEFDSFDNLIINLPSPRNAPSSSLQPPFIDPLLNEAPKLIK